MLSALRRLAGRIIWPQLVLQTTLVAVLVFVIGTIALGVLD